MKTINSYLPTLSDGSVSLTEVQLVKIITKNIPKAWKTQFKLADGHKLKTTIEAQKKLRLLEKDEKHRKQFKLKEKEKDVFKRKKDGGSSDTFKNKCTRFNIKKDMILLINRRCIIKIKINWLGDILLH